MQINFHDYSMEDPHIISTIRASQKVWLISYAGGAKVHAMNQNFQEYTSINKGVDIVIKYKREHIDNKFLAENFETLFKQKGNGYWLWKPYFIKKTLDIMQEGDILLYVDSGATIKQPLDDLLGMMNKYEMLVFANEFTIGQYVKVDAIKAVGLDLEWARQQPHFNAGFIILKKDEFSEHIIDEWLSHCKVPHLINDSPSNEPEADEFVAHRHDQALLNLVALKSEYREKIKLLEPEIQNEYFDLHHRMPHQESHTLILIDEDNKIPMSDNSKDKLDFNLEYSLYPNEFIDLLAASSL